MVEWMTALITEWMHKWRGTLRDVAIHAHLVVFDIFLLGWQCSNACYNQQ